MLSSAGNVIATRFDGKEEEEKGNATATMLGRGGNVINKVYSYNAWS